ncbi:hypothetical protein Bca101_050685 [Brassica carinata]
MKRFVYINDDEASKEVMNQYFLLIACLQLWSLITPVNPASTWGPLIFIFAVSASKEAWDDYHRFLSDKIANEKQIQAQEIQVGNIVWLRENDEVPCDLVLLVLLIHKVFAMLRLFKCGKKWTHTLQTAALDGETDLKTRVIPSACVGIDLELLHRMKGVLECPVPDKDIRRFDANMRLFPPFIDNDVCSLTIKNTLLQSCYLRNTEWACGASVYTGNQTKLGMSRGIAEPKLTAMDAMIDKLTGAIFVFQIVVVLVLGVAGNVWKDTEARKQWYVQYPAEAPWYELLVIPLRFELLCSIMIPISIKVSLDLVKGLYAKFIEWDVEMIDQETGTASYAANTAISEDLGQVEYILTDKTGTLTDNKMIFRRCCIGSIFYGNENGDALKDAHLLSAITSGSTDVIRFLTVMAIGNTVIPVRSKAGDIVYKAQSQDEEALVIAAAKLNMVFVGKNANLLEIRFNGADESILPYACAGQQTRTITEAVEHYAQLGLRTLCLAWRELEEDEYLEWLVKFKEASSVLVDREWRIAEVCQRLEHDLYILGVTAIEDRLQDGVPETIETLRKAGINFWMLTGDKQNTAIQIALSCNFISPEPKGQLLLIDGKSEEDVSRSLERVLLTMRNTTSEPKDVAFVIDGWALEIAVKHHRKDFVELAILSRTAICCRVTPSQKAQLVEILKSCDYRTLAIGDGGNDVRMIQQADIGVGISGREGLQAARAADYSIGRFRFLKRLILVHGRTDLLRYVFTFQYIASIPFLNTDNRIYPASRLFQDVPVLVSVIDKDLSETSVMQHPQILFYCQAGRLLNPSTFAGWFGRSLFHAIVVFVITIHAYANEKSEMEELGMVALSGCIWLQAFVVAQETNAIPSSGMYTIMFRLCSQPSYWITMFLIVGAGMGPIFALKYYRYTYRPSKINILQQAERTGGPIVTIGNIETQPRTMEKEVSPLSITQPKNRSPVYEPLLSESPNATRRSFGPGTPLEFFQSQSRLSSSSGYSRNCKDN